MNETFLLRTEQDTSLLAEAIVHLLQKGDILTLYGNLGSGKTFFTKKLGDAMGIKETISSPSFVLVNIYNSDKYTLFHIDLYRLNKYEEVLELGLEEMFCQGITAIEWPQLAEPILNGRIFKLTFENKPNKRTVKLELPDDVSLTVDSLQTIIQ